MGNYFSPFSPAEIDGRAVTLPDHNYSQTRLPDERMAFEYRMGWFFEQLRNGIPGDVKRANAEKLRTILEGEARFQEDVKYYKMLLKNWEESARRA